MIAAATSSRLTPTYPIPTPTCWPAHFPDDTQRMLLTFARAPYTVGAELSARHPADRLWRPIRCRLRLSQMSRPPPAPCRRVGRAHAKWGGAMCTRLGCKQHVYVRARSRCTRSAQCRGRVSADWGGGARRGAHTKHVAHVRDEGGVPAQLLVEGARVLPRVARRAHGAGRREERTTNM